MSRITTAVLLVALSLAVSATALADVVIYNIPNTNLVVVLQGRTSVNRGASRTFNYYHPALKSKLIISLEAAQRIEAPSTDQLATRQLGKAVLAGDAEKVMEAAAWALRHGLLDKYYEAIDKALELNPQHERALMVKRLKQQIDQPAATSTEQREHMQKVFPVPNMKFKESKHFLLMHDTSDEIGPFRRLSRSDERLKLLETVYESFLLRFYSHGVELEIPKEKLMVVLFSDHNTFLEYSIRLSPDLASAAGFWNSKNNISVFFDQGTTEEFKILKQLSAEYEALKAVALRERAANARDIVRMADTFTLLVEIAHENSDIEVVTHEATHQMAGNTGLFPRDVMIPDWVHEGLATYFEAPDDASWSGIGAVNEERLDWYRALEPNRQYSNLDFIVGDEIFKFAASSGATLHGYGQAWALTHFLMERHFVELMSYYRRLGEMPPDVVLSPQVLNRLFDEAFTTERRTLDAQWRVYMRSLKTEVAQILEEAK